MLALAMTASTLVVPAYSTLSRFLIEDLGLSRSQLGWLISSIAGVAAVLSPWVGRLADSFGGRTMLLAIFVGSVALLLGVAVAPTFAVLLLASILAGFLNAAGNPATNKTVVAFIPPGERGTIVGVKQSGVQIGTLLAGILLPGLSLALGWRAAIAVIAVVPAVGVVFAIRLKDEPLQAGIGSTLGTYRHPSGVRRIALYGFLMGAGVASIVSFLPLYAQERIGLEVTEAGFAMALIGLMGIVARVIWSRSSETIGRFASPLRAIAALSVLAVSAIWAADYGASWLLWVGVLVSGSSVVAWNGVANLGAVALVDARHVGHASGLVVLGFLGGFAVSPVLFGYSVESTGSYDQGWAGVLISFAVAAGVMHAWNQEERRKGATTVEADRPAP